MNVARPSEAPIALVTGASGFTGTYVCESLRAAGMAVVGWGNSGSIAQVEVDLCDPAAIAAALREVSPVVVVHLAGIAFVAHGDVDEMYRVNVVGTRNLLAALGALPQRPRHVLLASSANVYGNVSGVVSESTGFAPQNDYAVSKVAMEYMARLWAGELPLTIVRPFNYTGIGQSERFLLPKIVGHFRRRAPFIELGNLDVSRDFSDVRDVASAYSGLVEQPGSGEAFNICSGLEHSLADVISLLEEISGHRIEVQVNPAFVRANEVKRLVGDATKLQGVIGTKPNRKLEETLRWMYEAP